MSFKCDHKADGKDCMALTDAHKTIKDYKELIVTLQKEAERCQQKLKDGEAAFQDCQYDYKALSEELNNEKKMTHNLTQANQELHTKLNASMQETALWSQQYFNFMQTTIKGSADAMVRPPAAPMGGGTKK